MNFEDFCSEFNRLYVLRFSFLVDVLIAVRCVALFCVYLLPVSVFSYIPETESGTCLGVVLTQYCFPLLKAVDR